MIVLIQNIILGISLAAPIGPVNIEVIRRGMRFGFFSSFSVSLGAALADSTYLVLIYFGFTSLMSPEIWSLIWVFGAAILIFLGYQSIRTSFKEIKLEMGSMSSKLVGNSFLSGYLITISNPMTIVWWIGVFGAIIGSLHTASRIAGLLNCFAIILGVLIWFFCLSFTLHSGRKFINETKLRYISAVAGIFLIGFGLYFGYNALLSIFL